LEFFKDTHTVQELRQKLRETGAIAQNAKPKLVPIIHFLLFKYGVSFKTLVNASQGDNSKEIAEAQRYDVVIELPVLNWRVNPLIDAFLSTLQNAR